MVVFAGDPVLASDINTALERRVPVSHAVITVTTGALGAAEALVVTIPSATYKANTMFRVRIELGYNTSVANGGVYFRLRKTNLAGAIICDWQRAPEIAANNTLGHRWFMEGMFTTTAAVTTALAFTVATSAGTMTVLGGPPSVFDIYPDGAQTDWPDAGDLV
jgi:hypothetical protein